MKLFQPQLDNLQSCSHSLVWNVLSPVNPEFLFRFTVLSGKNIDKNQLRVYESLHVRVSLGLERFKTKLVPVSSCPVWRETGTLPRQNLEDNIFLVELFAR